MHAIVSLEGYRMFWVTSLPNGFLFLSPKPIIKGLIQNLKLLTQYFNRLPFSSQSHVWVLVSCKLQYLLSYFRSSKHVCRRILLADTFFAAFKFTSSHEYCLSHIIYVHFVELRSHAIPSTYTQLRSFYYLTLLSF